MAKGKVKKRPVEPAGDMKEKIARPVRLTRAQWIWLDDRAAAEQDETAANEAVSAATLIRRFVGAEMAKQGQEA